MTELVGKMLRKVQDLSSLNKRLSDAVDGVNEGLK